MGRCTWMIYKYYAFYIRAMNIYKILEEISEFWQAIMWEIWTSSVSIMFSSNTQDSQHLSLVHTGIQIHWKILLNICLINCSLRKTFHKSYAFDFEWISFLNWYSKQNREQTVSSKQKTHIKWNDTIDKNDWHGSNERKSNSGNIIKCGTYNPQQTFHHWKKYLLKSQIGNLLLRALGKNCSSHTQAFSFSPFQSY